MAVACVALSAACPRDGAHRAVEQRTDTPGERATEKTAATRVDSLFVERDIDGDGRLDYIVRERRKNAYRMAVYLNRQPGTGAPVWTTEWDDEGGDALALEQDYRVATDATLLFFVGSDADYTPEWLVTVHRGKVRDVITHREDHGEGYLQVKPDGEHVVIDATQDHLELNGTPVGPEFSCKSSEWPAVRLTYEASASRFVAEQPRCVNGKWPLDSRTAPPRR